MAKGARSSVRKANKTRLKKRVFGPAEDARTERLSQKLAELAAKPLTAGAITTSGAQQEGLANADVETDAARNTMDVDAKTATDAKPSGIKAEKRRKEAKAARVEKKKRTKPRNEMVFKKRTTAGRKSKR